MKKSHTRQFPFFSLVRYPGAFFLGNFLCHSRADGNLFFFCVYPWFLFLCEWLHQIVMVEK